LRRSRLGREPARSFESATTQLGTTHTWDADALHATRVAHRAPMLRTEAAAYVRIML
jgi:hypothetical protein